MEDYAKKPISQKGNVVKCARTVVLAQIAACRASVFYKLILGFFCLSFSCLQLSLYSVLLSASEEGDIFSAGTFYYVCDDVCSVK